jgi:hypothetical protein
MNYKTPDNIEPRTHGTEYSETIDDENIENQEHHDSSFWAYKAALERAYQEGIKEGLRQATAAKKSKK